jgi:hypothetical protein
MVLPTAPQYRFVTAATRFHALAVDCHKVMASASSLWALVKESLDVIKVRTASVPSVFSASVAAGPNALLILVVGAVRSRKVRWFERFAIDAI